MLTKLFMASRPATLVVSILSTFLGIIVAYRQGYEKGKIIYYSLIAFAYINTTILVIFNYLPTLSMIVLLTIPLIREIVRSVNFNKKRLIPITARIYLLFSIELFLVLILTK